MTDSTRFAPNALLASVFGLALLLLTPMAASAHDQIVEQSPVHDEHFDTSPETIKLTLNNEPLDLGNIVMVVDASGNDHAIGEPQIQNFTVTQAVTPNLPDGYYQVRWRVVSSDGHPISESFLFSVGTVTDDTPKPSINSVTTPTESENLNAGTADQGSADSALGIDEYPINTDNAWRTAFFVLGGTTVAAIIICLILFSRKSERDPQPAIPEREEQL